MKKIALFIPVFNEAEALNCVLGSIPTEISGRKVDIIVVDDCSIDDSFRIARRFTKHVIRLEENRGVGATTRKGFEYISALGGYDFVLKMDGDGQHNVDFLCKMVDALENQNDVVVCSRFHQNSDQSHTPSDRILLNSLFSKTVSDITGWKITDARSGYMGFHFNDVKRIAQDIIVPRYGIPMEILLRIWNFKRHARVVEFAHPAVYGGDISSKLENKYITEDHADKARRFSDAITALLSVMEDIKMPREHLLGVYGLMVAA